MKNSPEKNLTIPEEFIDPSWTVKEITIRQMSYRENLKLRDESTKIQMIGKEMKATISQEAMNLGMLVKCVTKAPWKVNDVTVYADVNFNQHLGQWLEKEVSSFNSIDEKKNLISDNQ